MPILKCPQCDSQLELDAEAAGMEVQCGSCQHVFTAKFPEKKSQRPATDDAPPMERPSKRGNREDDEEEGPPKRRRRDEDDEDDGPPKRRSRMREDDEDDDFDRRPRRRKQPEGGKGLGIASMVCGIVGLILTCCCGLFAVLDVVAIVLGFLSLKTPGKGMGIAGIICGAIGLILMVLSLILNLGMRANNFGGGGGNPFR